MVSIVEKQEGRNGNVPRLKRACFFILEIILEINISKFHSSFRINSKFYTEKYFRINIEKRSSVLDKKLDRRQNIFY